MRRPRSLPPLRVFLAFALLAAGGACSLLRMPTLEQAHPKSYAELIAFAPECAHPTQAAFAPCDDAAGILEADPRHATDLFRASWRARVLDQLPDYRYSGVSPDPLGDQQQRAIANDAAALLDRTIRPALARVLARAPGPYTTAVKTALDAVQWKLRASFEAFDKAEATARLLPAATPTATATVEPTPVEL